jgi:hypothetical protein
LLALVPDYFLYRAAWTAIVIYDGIRIGISGPDSSDDIQVFKDFQSLTQYILMSYKGSGNKRVDTITLCRQTNWPISN